MCTAINFKTKNMYFGRTLDYEFSYGEKITITPREYEFKFRHLGVNSNHYAIIGMAHVFEDYPLYYEAANEKGLAVAGLNFVGNAYYRKPSLKKNNVAQYEFIPWILANFSSVAEVKKALKNINITDDEVNEKFKCASLHWLISDLNEAIVVESTSKGIKVYDNKVGVLTNNPPFEYQMFNLNNYQNLSICDPANSFSEKIDLNRYSRGMGGIGLPGDLSSMSRFVRVAFHKLNSKCKDDEFSSVNQFFHVMNSVLQTRGLCAVNDNYEITIYTSCINLNEGKYYYTTYNNHQINMVDLHKVDLDQKDLVTFKFLDEENINIEN